MISTNTLELFAKQAATDYLRDGKSLNGSITKIASDNGLNNQQIARVVEAANTDVYINLVNKSADRYVQYDVADPVVIQSNLHTTKVAEVSDDASDYFDAPGYETPEITPIFEKVAEEEQPASQDGKLKNYWRFKAAEANLTGLLLEGQHLFSQETASLRDMIKQAVLGGTPYNDIFNALSVNEDPIFTETLKAIEAELTPNMPIGSLNKTAETLTHPVNGKHPLVQQSLKLVKIANEFKTIQERLSQLEEEWALYKMGGAIGATVKAILSKPAVFGTGLAVGAGAGALALPYIAKESIKREQNPLNQIPARYRG
jgi:hypothetical protein